MLDDGGPIQNQRAPEARPGSARADGRPFVERAPHWWQRLTAGWPAVPGLRGSDTLAVLDASPDAVIGMDGAGVCIFANAAAERMFGLPAAELVGSGAHLLVPRLSRAVQATIAGRAGTDGSAGLGTSAEPEGPVARDEADARQRIPSRRSEPSGPAGQGLELTAVRRGGSTFPAMVWITPAYSGRRLVAVATVRDLSAEQAATAATRALLDDVHELRAVVNAVTSAVTERAIILADAQGHITAFNRAAEKLLGYRSEDVIGRPTVNLSDPADIAAVRAELRTPAGVDPLLEITRSGLPNQQDWVFLTRDGQRRPVSLRITAIGDRDEPVGFVCVAGDRAVTWEPLTSSRPGGDRLLLDLDDAETRALRWQVGGSGYARRR